MDQVEYWYAIASVLLFFKMFAISAYQGFHRIGKLTFKIPEDAAFVGREPAEEELPQVQRAARAWLNDLENIPVFLALGVAYIWVEATSGMAPWLFMVFTAARYLHTLFYLGGIQPWRTVAYAVGVVCMFIMSFQILYALP
ncbi:MAPEG family protein [Marinobacter sp. F4218]|uniref:MAPEG family protein n=1 Tax=Marinobacter sp. F4218 TaxID=2862868 RepID=UPI001C62699A|nr:MAPEG family protein [Marinobacter sp. F4218]MBW7471691.1 MAPEG family protein [Marinobacter sp. F4218]